VTTLRLIRQVFRFPFGQRPILALLAMFFVAHSTMAADTITTPVLSFDADSVIVSNVSVSGKVVLIGTSLSTWRNLPLSKAERIVIADDDRDGIIRYKLNYKLPLRSIWVAIDFETGGWTIGGPPGYSVDIQAFPEASLHANAAGEIDFLEQERQAMEVIVVRPGEGAWVVFATQSRPSNAEQAKHGRLKVVFEGAKVFESSRTLKQLKKGDVVIGLDSRAMQVFATRMVK
jgi:hypothetical protein